MSLAKLILEGAFNNTYGIEIEFGTHNNQMLSFTHIEVCYLYPIGSSPDKGWKIETDADYTLELVSPILKFQGQKDARDFRDELMGFLQSLVQSGTELGMLMRFLDVFVKTKFIFGNGIWTYIKNRPPEIQLLELRSEWITNKKMIEALTWENWDEDTDLEQVLASKKIIQEEQANLSVAQADQAMAARMKQVIITQSRKHGGLPSSQLNLPLRLPAFVVYETKYKRDKAWERLLETETSKPKYIADKVEELGAGYPSLANNDVWKAKYKNSDYVESQIDEKTRFWHRYWLWLETFYVCAGHLSGEGYNNMAFIDAYVRLVDHHVDSAEYPSRKTAEDALKAMMNFSNQSLAHINYANNITADILYLTMHKLAAGALSELSETLQMKAQEKIMNLEGDLSMEQIMNTIPNNQFMQFHYASKDLTSLWFKASLFDTIACEESVDGQRDAAQEAQRRIKSLRPNDISSVIVKVLTANLKLLGWYYSVSEANNQGYDYDWEEFCSYNMPSIPAFEKSLTNSCAALIEGLYGRTPELFSYYVQLPADDVTFLKRTYTKAENEYLASKDIAIGYVAPWEGRWDTMKRVIETDPQRPLYLIEHRNN